jgi:hypothetical protein
MKSIFRRAAAAAVLLTSALLAPAWCSGGSTADPVSGTEAERSIDWHRIDKGDPIPALMPTSRSADSLDAGFSPEWVEHSVRPFTPPAGEESAPLALAIMSQQRASDDVWSDEVENYLREFIRTQVNVQAPTVSRVFCNFVGCLCYLERTGAPLTQFMVYKALQREAASRFGIRQMGMWTLYSPRPRATSWELTIITRPTKEPGKSSEPDGTNPTASPQSTHRE